MIKNRASFTWLFIPLVIYLVLMALLYVERTGAQYQIGGYDLEFLEVGSLAVESNYSEPPVNTLVLYDSLYVQESTIYQPIISALDAMRVPYDFVDILGAEPFDFKQYRIVVLAFHHLGRFKQLTELTNWVESGGRVMVGSFPGVVENHSSIYRKFGIRTLEDNSTEARGVRFVTDLLPGAKGLVLDGADNFLVSSSMPVQLEDDAVVHITSADEYQLPLLWEMEYGNGRFVVVNTDQLTNRVNRGIISAAYSLLDDIFVYPVINASVFFIDDFPAPIPDGENEVITDEFNRNVRSFMLDIWWPEMRRLSDKYGIKYTGLLIETYNDKVDPPFKLDVSVDDHRYMGQMLLWRGGEVGLHGYNHVPLCQAKDNINQQFKYPTWPSEEAGQMAIQELNSFGESLFQGNTFTVYVPPSNILCPEARAWLPKALPKLRVISALSLEEEDQGTYMQEFGEAADGIIEFPRIVSGFKLYEGEELALVNELVLHFVNSHFIHPDDILDPVRRDGRTWETMLSQIEGQFSWLQKNLPMLRNLTASEGAMATQRYARLKVSAVMENNRFKIHLGNFYDEAFLLMRTRYEPVNIIGGKITRVTSSLYLIEANQPDLEIEVRK